MEYGLWGLPGGFWTGGTPEALTRSLYNAGHGRGPKLFSGNIENMTFENMTSTSILNRKNRNQEIEIAAMKNNPSKSLLQLKASQQTDLLQEQTSSLQSTVSQEPVPDTSHDEIGALALIVSNNNNNNDQLEINAKTNKKLKTNESSRKDSLNSLPLTTTNAVVAATASATAAAAAAAAAIAAVTGTSTVVSGGSGTSVDSGTSLWSRSNTEKTIQYLNQHQYNPMYSMMFGRLPTIHQATLPLSRSTALEIENISMTNTLTSDTDDDEDEDDISIPKNNLPKQTGSEIFDAKPHLSPSDNEHLNNNSDLSRSSGFECGECGLTVETRPSLSKHITDTHGPLLPPAAAVAAATAIAAATSSITPGPATLACPMPQCPFHCERRDQLESHVAKHVAEGYTPTGKRRSSGVSLQRVRYEREEYRCQLCSYTCTIEKAFYKHLKFHAAQSNGHGSATSPNLVKISCVVCGKDRPSEVEMNKHMRKHRDNRYFCCDICIFRTVQLKKLIQHRRMHTGEKPHLCPHCAYRSARRDNLRSHVRRVHKKENLYCDTFSPRGILPIATQVPRTTATSSGSFSSISTSPPVAVSLNLTAAAVAAAAAVASTSITSSKISTSGPQSPAPNSE